MAIGYDYPATGEVRYLRYTSSHQPDTVFRGAHGVYFFRSKTPSVLIRLDTNVRSNAIMQAVSYYAGSDQDKGEEGVKIFGNQLPAAPVQWLSDNVSAYTAEQKRLFSRQIGLQRRHPFAARRATAWPRAS